MLFPLNHQPCAKNHFLNCSLMIYLLYTHTYFIYYDMHKLYEKFICSASPFCFIFTLWHTICFSFCYITFILFPNKQKLIWFFLQYFFYILPLSPWKFMIAFVVEILQIIIYKSHCYIAPCFPLDHFLSLHFICTHARKWHEDAKNLNWQILAIFFL